MGLQLSTTKVVIDNETRSQVNFPLSVVYIEVNHNNFQNVACYSLSSPGNPRVFDIAIIFAANINYDIPNQRAVVFLNDQVTKVLTESETSIKPVQQQGTKVLLNFLGNHQGAGICNLPTLEAVKDFAQQIADIVNKYNLDGVDFDDEYAEYGKNGTDLPNNFSFVYLLRELRGLLPDKIISFYFIGQATSHLSYGQDCGGDYLDFSWTGEYGYFSPPKVPKMGKSQLGAAAGDLCHTTSGEARELAKLTKKDGFGVYLYYNLSSKNVSELLSSVTEELYGIKTEVKCNCLKP